MQHFTRLLETSNMLSRSSTIEAAINKAPYVANGPWIMPVTPNIVEVEAPKAASRAGITVVQQRLLGSIAIIAAPSPILLVWRALFDKAYAFIDNESESSTPIKREAIREGRLRPKIIFGNEMLSEEDDSMYE
ncbi:MAG: hypothetical protein ACP5UC_01450 [Candidatus Micrarchaeia archaeon]